MSEIIKLDTVEEAVSAIRDGQFVIVVDDENRENEGDLIIAAEKITPDQVNFMLTNGRGVLCVPLTISRCEELGLTHQVADNTSLLGTPFTITVDKLEGCTTGVSAHDRAATIRALADPESTAATFGRPDTSIRFMPTTTVSSAATVTPRLRLTSRVRRSESRSGSD